MRTTGAFSVAFLYFQFANDLMESCHGDMDGSKRTLPEERIPLETAREKP